MLQLNFPITRISSTAATVQVNVHFKTDLIYFSSGNCQSRRFSHKRTRDAMALQYCAAWPRATSRRARAPTSSKGKHARPSEQPVCPRWAAVQCQRHVTRDDLLAGAVTVRGHGRGWAAAAITLWQRVHSSRARLLSSHAGGNQIARHKPEPARPAFLHRGPLARRRADLKNTRARRSPLFAQMHRRHACMPLGSIAQPAPC